MGRLIYSGITSLDGYTEDADGNFHWSTPDEEVHRFVNDLTRPARTHLLGAPDVRDDGLLGHRRPRPRGHRARFRGDLAGRRQGRVLADARPSRPPPSTRLEREFDPDAVRRLKAATEHDLTIGGPELAAHAIAAGLVDEYQQFVNPVIVGGGKPFLPGGVRIGLELVEERRFSGGVVFLRYAAG